MESSHHWRNAKENFANDIPSFQQEDSAEVEEEVKEEDSAEVEEEEEGSKAEGAAGTYACPECGKGPYANPDSLRKHAKTVHEMVLAYCRDCCLAFKTFKAKDAHVAKAHPGGEPVKAGFIFGHTWYSGPTL